VQADLRDLAVLVGGEDHVGPGDPAQQAGQLGEPPLGHGPEARGHARLATGVLDLHAPSVRRPGGGGAAQWTDLRRLEGGIRSSSRYLATVRRARGRPWLPSSSAMRESDNGCTASSPSIILRILSLMVTELMASPMLEVMPLWKKKRSSNTPRGVCMYLLATTRDTVDSCMPMSVATSRSTSGRRWAMPWSRKARWWRTIDSDTL